MTRRAPRPAFVYALGFAWAALMLSLISCETPTVECWPDPAVGTACRCTQGVTPPTCVDLGTCLAECPLP
jgi:hypothetical protein